MSIPVWQRGMAPTHKDQRADQEKLAKLVSEKKGMPGWLLRKLKRIEALRREIEWRTCYNHNLPVEWPVGEYVTRLQEGSDV